MMNLELADDIQKYYQNLGYTNKEAHTIVKGLWFWLLETQHDIVIDVSVSEE